MARRDLQRVPVEPLHADGSRRPDTVESSTAGQGRRPGSGGDRVTRRRAGDAQNLGRLAGLVGPFVLAPGLTAPGALPLTEALDLVCTDLERQGAAGIVEPSTVYMTVNQTRRFERYALQHGAVTLADVDSELLELFVHSPNAPGYGTVRSDGRPGPAQNSTKHGRRNVVRALFKTARALGLDNRDPSRDIALPPRTTRAGRAATDTEVQRCREGSHATLSENRLQCSLALALVGETSAELPYATVGDVHLDDRLVWAHGGGVKTEARWLPLDDWAVEAITRRTDWVTGHPSGRVTDPEGEPLVYRPRKPDNPHHIRHGAGSSTLGKILRLAGLSQVPGLRPMSLYEWVGQTVYTQTGSLTAVACRLGMVSLDATADLLDIDWRVDSEMAGPPGVQPRPSSRLSRLDRTLL